MPYGGGGVCLIKVDSKVWTPCRTLLPKIKIGSDPTQFSNWNGQWKWNKMSVDHEIVLEQCEQTYTCIGTDLERIGRDPT